MSPSPLGRKAIWILPIALAVCALMVLPGATFVASGAHGNNPMSAAAGLSSSPVGNLAGPSPSVAGPSNHLGNLAGASGSPTTAGLLSGNSAATDSLLANGIPANLASVPWINSVLHPGASHVQPTVSLPDFALLQHPITSTNGVVNPVYVAQPAPLGITDFGLGAKAYSYNTSHFLGQVTFNTPPNATQPGSTGVIEPAAIAQHRGLLGNEYEFGIQLNTVVDQVSIPGTNNGTFWTQNVANWNDTAIHFASDTFNFSLNSFTYIPPSGTDVPATILSGCGLNTAGVNNILEVYGGVFQCVGGSVPISAADFPITLQLYNNATITAGNDAQVTFAYRIIEAGTGVNVTGVYNTVVFNNPNASATAKKDTQLAYPPLFTVSGTTTTPNIGNGRTFFRASELDLLGGIGGANAVFHSLNATANLEYSNVTSGGWQNVPSAYNFGANTGETGSGIADFWTPSHTLELNQGPTILYGLWNAEPQVSVPSGDIELSGTINPSYGFVFVSNTPPVADPFAVGAAQDNMSYLPSSASGAFATYLPPAKAPWDPTATYYLQAFADGAAEYNGTITGTASVTITLGTSAVNKAPLYMAGDAQAAALDKAVGGSGTAPYVFNGAIIAPLYVNFTFDHVNIFGYSEFELFQAIGVTAVVNVTNLYMPDETDSSTGTYYLTDYNFAASGILQGFSIPAFEGDSVPNFNNAIYLFDDVGCQVYNFDSYAVEDVGGPTVFLWEDSGAIVKDTVNEFGGSVTAGNSVDTTFLDSTEEFTDGGIVDLGSTGTLASNIYVDDALGIETLSASHATYKWINVTDDGQGVGGGFQEPGLAYYNIPGSLDTTIDWLNATDDSSGANITLADGTTINNASAYDPVDLQAWILSLDATDGTTITNPDAYFAGGLYSWNATDTNITNFQETWGTYYYDSWLAYSNGTTLTNANVSYCQPENCYYGFEFEGGYGFTGTSLNTTDSEVAYLVDAGNGTVAATDVNDWGTFIGLGFEHMGAFTAKNVYANDTGVDEDLGGVATYAVTAGAISDVTAVNYAVGVSIEGGSVGVTVSDVSASAGVLGGSVGVYVDPASAAISGVSANDDSIGTILYDASNVTISGTTATNYSIGDWIDDSARVSDTGASAFDGNSTAVVVDESNIVNVKDVKATSTKLGTVYGGLDGVPNAAVFTEDTIATSVSGVTATNYGSALYDYGSDGLQASDINATNSVYAVVWNDTYNGYFDNIGAYHDYIGVLAEGYGDADDNYVTGSSFVGDASYAVALIDAEDNTFVGNSFIANNGATTTYNPAHVQATAAGYNTFYTCTNFECTTGAGNYWADWHTYGSNGYLAPYVISGETEDLFPSGPQETFTVNFIETGLPAGTVWSVSVAGVTHTSNTTTITFQEPMGTYLWVVNPLSGWAATPPSGSATVAGGVYNTSLVFTSTSTASLVTTNTFNQWFAVALALAVIALVIALLALLLRRGGKQPPAQSPGPAQEWTPPAGSAPAGATSPPPSSGSGTWSEGPPPANPPPSQ